MIAFGIVVVLFLAWAYIDRPDKDEVGTDLVFGGELLAYEIWGWNREPQVVFRRDGAVRRDNLRRDWISIEWPPVPAWQLDGNWVRINSSGAPASVGVIDAGPTELFGEINSPAITTMEVQYDGEWHAFPVEAPGFLLRLGGFDGVPTAYRWLDANGNTVHTRDRIEPRER